MAGNREAGSFVNSTVSVRVDDLNVKFPISASNVFPSLSNGSETAHGKSPTKTLALVHLSFSELNY